MLARKLYEGLISEALSSKKVYLEIGSYDGDGIATLSRMFPKKKFYSIDPFIEDGHTWQAPVGQPMNNIRAEFVKNTKDYKNIIHFDMTDEKFLKKKLYKTISPDVLFIDGNHSYECVTLDLKLAELFAKKKRLYVVMDDTVNIEGVVKALAEFKLRHPEIEFKSLPDYGAVYFTI
jgi:hypothetical protein